VWTTLFSDEADEDYDYWVSTNQGVVDRINKLIDAIYESPFTGIGKPEPLKEDYHTWWSRRINREHRLIYRVSGPPGAQKLEILSCRFHY
jgi:toxin YoeB